MANVNIKFNNKDYLLSCDEGQEESLKSLTKFLDKKYSELKDKLGNIGENKLLLITTILRKCYKFEKNYHRMKMTIRPQMHFFYIFLKFLICFVVIGASLES